MSNINSIEVNGQTYGLESVNDIAVSYTEPTGTNRPGTWLKPAGLFDLQGSIGMEYKTGSTSSYGDYTLDDNGNLVETSDTSQATGSRCTKIFGLFRNKSYSLENTHYGNFTPGTNELWTWEVYFYDVNKQFISKSVGQLEPNVAVSAGAKVVEFVMPQEARYIRIKAPVNRLYYFDLVDDEANIQVSGDGRYGSSYSDHMFKLDGDHYVMV